jgi:hypothetical protein
MFLLCKVHYHVHKIPPQALIVSHVNSVRTFPPYYSKIHLLPSHLCLGLSSDYFLRDFQPEYFAYLTYYHAFYMPRTSYFSWFDPNIVWGVQIVELLIMYANYGGNKLLWNLDLYQPDYTVIHSRRHLSSFSVFETLLVFPRENGCFR